VLVEGQDVGRVTSAVFSPRENGTLAFAYVQRDYISSGTAVAIRSGARILQARVRQLGK
jgi:glycine cleavage system aminomethyltransferase T